MSIWRHAIACRNNQFCCGQPNKTFPAVCIDHNFAAMKHRSPINMCMVLVLVAFLVFAASECEARHIDSKVYSQPSVIPDDASPVVKHQPQGNLVYLSSRGIDGRQSIPAYGVFLPAAHPRLQQWPQGSSYKRLEAASAIIDTACADSCADCEQHSINTTLMYSFAATSRVQYAVKSTVSEWSTIQQVDPRWS